MSPAIEIRELQKTFHTSRGNTISALQSVSLCVDRGTIFGLIGQNGAGKTTLVKILLGLAVPTSGSVRLLDGSPTNPSVRRRVGYLPEQMRLPEYFKAEDFLGYMGALNGLGPATLRDRIPVLLETVGLAGVRKPLKAYSKGMQQRLGLAQALVNDPEMLFLDEPTDGLDPLGRKDVRDLLIRLRAQGKTIFLNSHLLSEIELVCDQIVILNRGKVVRAVTPAEFSCGTGEYVVCVTAASDAVRTAAAAVMRENASWEQNRFRFAPRDLAQLNFLLDRLRSVPVEIESVEPVRLSLEDLFLQAVAGRES